MSCLFDHIVLQRVVNKDPLPSALECVVQPLINNLTSIARHLTARRSRADPSISPCHLSTGMPVAQLEARFRNRPLARCISSRNGEICHNKQLLLQNAIKNQKQMAV